MPAPRTTNQMKPNILLIMTDQHSPHVAGFAGNGVVRTQALDELASRSLQFNAAYCQSPLCVPSRNSFLTGKLADRCHAWDNHSPIRVEDVTMPGWFADRGYATACVGKMHFRGDDQMQGWQYRPFGDTFSGWPLHQPDPPDTADGRWAKHAVGRFPFAGPSSIPESLLTDHLVTKESLAWLLELSDQHRDQPWLFCASYSRPHFPLTAPARYVRFYEGHPDLRLPPLPDGFHGSLHPHDRFIVDDFRLLDFPPEKRTRGLAAYYACVDYVDDCIGELLRGLEGAGILDNTVIVYLSDHGELAGEHGLWWKRSYYEASAKVPLLLCVPGTSPATIETPVELVDLFPTVCELAGIDTPEGLDGESLCTFTNGRPHAYSKRIARSSLLGGHPSTRFRMVRNERWKLVEFPNASARLFDLQADPGERDDLADHPPFEAPLDELRAELAQTLDWEQIDRTRESEGQPKESPRPRASAQYMLPDGRLAPADEMLYTGTR